jgi:hypothetical protein
MNYVEKPAGARPQSFELLASEYQVDLPLDLIDWWSASDGPIVYFGYKELQFFSIREIVDEDIYELKKYMPNSMPICMDGNGNICVARIKDQKISGYYVASCGDLGWEEARLLAKDFNEFVNDNISPEARLNA